MTTFQKLIKIAALVFAVFLAASIITGIVGGVFTAGMVISKVCDKIDENNNPYKSADAVEWHSKKLSGSFDEIDCDLRFSDIDIKIGDGFEVRYQNPKLSVKTDGSAIKIDEPDGLSPHSFSYDIEVIVPEGTELEKISVSSSAGGISADSVKTQYLDVDCDAGSFSASAVFVAKTAKVELDAGSISVKSGSFGKIEGSVSAGTITFTGEVTEKGDFSSDAGSIYVTLCGNRDSYHVDAESSFSSVTIDGRKTERRSETGFGDVDIEIDASAGRIEVGFDGR